MKIYQTLDSTNLEKKLVIAVNDHENHIKLISKQYGESLSKINKLEKRIKSLEEWKSQQKMIQANQI